MAIVSPRPRRALADSVADLGSKVNLYKSSQGPPVSAAARVDGLGLIDEEKQMEVSEPKKSLWSRRFGHDNMKEQTIPGDATLNEASLERIINIESYDSGLPLGIITLEDVLEELM